MNDFWDLNNMIKECQAHLVLFGNIEIELEVNDKRLPIKRVFVDTTRRDGKITMVLADK